MPFNPSQGLGKYESKPLRALKALPFIGISALAGYFMFGVAAPPMLDYVNEVFEKGIQSFSGEGLFKPLESFYGLKAIDEQLKPITAVFGSVQFGDEIGNWQTFQFLQDAGVLYAIMLLEGARRANLMTILQAPLIFGLLMQLLGIGVFMPVYLFIHYIMSPMENFRARDLRLTSMAWTASILPVLLLTLYIPHYGSFLSSFGNVETRHKWIWIQLLFPIFTSVVQYLFKKTRLVSDTVQVDRIHHPNRDLPTIGFTLLSLSAVAASSWLYTLTKSPFSLATILMPNIAESSTGADFTRLFLQFDHTSMLASAFLWLIYLFGDMKGSGFLKDIWFSILLKGLLSTVILGPGATIGLGFLWRENILASKWHNEAIIPEAWK